MGFQITCAGRWEAMISVSRMREEARNSILFYELFRLMK